MKKKEANLAVTAGNEKYLSLEQRILRSDLSEQDKIELIKMIGRDRTSSWTYSIPQIYHEAPNRGNLPYYSPDSSSASPDCPKPTITYC